MSLGVVVVAYRDVPALQRSLGSLGEVRQVVVVNVTQDPSVADAIESHGRSALPVETNVGYAAAVNAGVEALHSECDTVLFMNDDVRLLSLPPEAGGECVRLPSHFSVDGAPTPFVHSLPTPTRFLREWVFGRRSNLVSEGPLPAYTFANGAAVVAPRTVLQRFPLPAEYFMYWEETAWFWRLADAGIPVQIDSFSIERPPGSEEFSALKSRLLGENLMRLTNERYGPLSKPVYLALGMLWTIRLAATDARSNNRVERWRARWGTAAGLLAGCARSFDSQQVSDG